MKMEQAPSERYKAETIQALHRPFQTLHTIGKHIWNMSSSTSFELLTLQEDASVIKVVIAGTIILLNSISCGTAVAFSTPAAVTYSSPNATTLPEPLNEEEISWLMSIIQIAILCSTLFSGAVSDALGRKKALIIAQVLVLLGWTIIFFAWNFTVLLIGRCIMGAGIGVGYPTICLYLSEISLIRLRGTFAVMNTVMTNASFIYALVFAAVLPLKGLIIVCALTPTAFLLTAYFLPESPIWLMKEEKRAEAEQTMLKLRGPQYIMALELHDIQSVLNDGESSGNQGFFEKFKALNSRIIILPILMMVLMFVLQPITGSDMVAFYSLDIFRRANVQMNNYLLSILVQSGFLAGYIVSAFLLIRVPRKVQFVCSGLFMASSQLALGYVLNKDFIGSGHLRHMADALLPICVICTGFAYAIGVGPVLYALLGEVLPQRVKALACAIILSTRNLMTFVNLKIFPSAVNALGLHYMFWIHAAICVLICILAGLILPETRGKSLKELSRLYEKKKDPEQDHRISKVDPFWSAPSVKRIEASQA